VSGKEQPEDLNRYILSLDDARADFKRIKSMDKTAKRLFVGAAGTLTVGVPSAFALSGGWIVAILVAGEVFGLFGMTIWLYVHQETKSFGRVEPMSRYQYYRSRVRTAEATIEWAMKL